MTIDASVYGDDFTENGVEIFYFDDPDYIEKNIDESPANVENQIIIKTDFKNNNIERLGKEGNFTCRFKAEDGRTAYTQGHMVRYPLDKAHPGQKPNSIICPTAKWNL